LSFGKTLLHRKQGGQINTRGKVTTPARINTAKYAPITSDHTNR